MRSSFGAAFANIFVFSGLVFSGASSAIAAEEDLSACIDAVGTFLTTNVGAEGTVVGRSLISLTDGGHFFLTDSNEGGSTNFASFSDGYGAWRCESAAEGKAHILAVVLDFTHKSEAHPNQTMARLDYDAVYDAATDTLSADVSLYFVPIDANPMDTALLKDAVPNKITGVRVRAP